MIRSALLAALCTLALTACGGNRLKVYLTDAPLDGATAVNITVSGLQVIGSDDEGAGGEEEGSRPAGAGKPAEAGPSTVRYEEPRVINLLELRNGVTTLLGEVEVNGAVEQLRLLMDGKATVVFEDGTSCEAFVPSGAETGVKITGIPAGTSEVTLDFDAARSIIETGAGELIMRPTISAMVDGEVVAETPPQ